MVTFQIISDTHLECVVRSLSSMLDKTADILCLLGDIGSPFTRDYVEFLEQCSTTYKHVLVIAGNHEYYNTHGYSIATINEGISGLCSRFPNVHFLNNSTFIIDNVQFIGSVLWSELPEENKDKVAALYNDYNYIYADTNVKLYPDYTNTMFKTNKAFIEQAINHGIQNNYKNVVLTHHMPTHKFSDPKHAESLYKYGLGTELSHAFDGQYIAFWACGHTHKNLNDMNINGTILITNQYGRRPDSLKHFSKHKFYKVE